MPSIGRGGDVVNRIDSGVLCLGVLDNPAVWKHMKATGSDLLPINHGILGCPDAP